MKKYWYLILFFPLLLMSQKEDSEQIDSLLRIIKESKDNIVKANALNEVSYSYRFIDPYEGIAYGKKSLNLSKKINWVEGEANAYKNIGVNCFSLGEQHDALSAYNTAFKITTDAALKATLLNNIGLIYATQSDNAKGLSYAFRALKIRESINDKIGIAGSLSNIGMFYHKLNDIRKAIRYYEKSVKVNELLKSRAGQISLSRTLQNLGNAYYEDNQKSKAFSCFKKGLSISNALDDKVMKASYFSSLANCYLDQKNYDLAIKYCLESLNLTSNPITDELNNARCYSIFGTIYLEMAQLGKINQQHLDNAKINFNKALQIHKKTNELKTVSDDYEQLSVIETLKGNEKAAFDLYKSSVIYKDSIFNSTNRETIKNLEDRRIIEIRDKEIKINLLKLENKEKQKWYLIIGIVLLVIIGVLLFYQSQNRKKNNFRLQQMNLNLDNANHTKTQLLSILNHDLKSPVNSFIHYIQLRKENPDLLDKNTKVRIEEATLTSAKNLLHSMEDILLWTKDQMENFGPQFKTVTVDSLFDDTQNHFDAEKKVRFHFDNPDNIILITDENYLKTIIRNLTGNAIKALASFVPRNDNEIPNIIWKAWLENNQTYLSITDNGSGSTQEQFKALYDDKEILEIKSGLGLHLIRNLSKAINCEIVVDSKINSGTTITLKLK